MAKANEYFLRLSSGYLFPEIARRAALWQEKHPGVKLLKLGIGNTTEPITPHIAKKMREKIDALENRNTYTGYGDEQGDTPLRKAIAELYGREYGVSIDPLEVFVSDGAKSDAANIQEIFSEDSVVAVQDPAYPVYVDSNVASGRGGFYDEKKGLYDRLIYMPASEKDNFIPHPPKEHVDLIYLCFPNNPTGAVISKERLREFVEYAKREKAVIIYDAAYSDYIREEGYPHTIYEIEGAKDVAIEINSFSKNAGFTGVRLGWSIVPFSIKAESAPDGTIHRLWNRRQTTFFNGASNIAQAGGIAALSEEGRLECKGLVDYYLENARIIREGLEASGLRVFGGVNSPYVWAKCPEGLRSWEFFDLLIDKAHVIVTPGSGFGAAGEGYVRVSAYGHREDVIKAVESIRENLK